MEGADGMKAATETFNTEDSKPASQSAKKHSKSTRNQYFLVVALLATAYLFTIWASSTPSTTADTHAGLNFVFFWLGGGLVTLVLLALAAKR